MWRFCSFGAYVSTLFTGEDSTITLPRYKTMVPSVLKGGGQTGRATGMTSDGAEGVKDREGRGVAAAPTQGRGRDGNENHACFLKLKCQRRIAMEGGSGRQTAAHSP